MIKKLLLFVRLLLLTTFSIFSLDNSRGKLSVKAKMFCFALLFCVSFANAATYYSGINGAPTDANNLNNWWLNTNGTGGHPANFTTGGDIFIVQTGHSMATTAAWAVTGSLQIQTGGTLSVAAFDITISGTTSITGSLIHSSNTGTKTYVGLVTIASGGVWNNSSNTGVIFRGGITNNGTFTSGSGVHTFNTNNQSVTGNFSIPKITVNGVSLTNISTNTLNVATALDGTGTLINQGTLNIAASTVLITTLTATATGNKVNYSGAAQTIKSTSYYDLTFTGSGVKTFGTTTVATSNFINVASGVKLDLSGNNGHTARVLILGGVGPLINSWGAQGSGATNTTDTYFTNTSYGRIIVSGSGTFDPVIDSNYASYTKGVSGKVNASYVENAVPTVLTAPNGTVFVNADFASYGTPTGTAPNFTLGTCNAFNSRTVATDVFLGNTTATIPATNATFGDPCVSIVKRLSVVATYTEPICINTSPGIITGSPPTGGNGTYTYLWEVSTTSAVSGYTAAPGTNNAKDYTPGNLTTTSWFRRTVYSGLYASETIVIVQVNNAPVAPTAIANTAFCATGATTLTVSGGSKGGNGGYAQWYTGSCGGTLVGSGDSITVTPTAPTTYYVRYQNGCTTTACFSKLIEATVSITAASAATPVCYNASAIQTTPLAYSATTGTPTTYSIAWNASPTNSFVAVANATLPAANISVSVPAGTNPGIYTGTLTVKNGTCVSLQNTFTVTVNALPTITGTANVCIGSTTQLTGSATADATTPWASGTPTVATVSNTGLVTGVAAGTSVITYKNSNGCTQTVTVTVNSLPTITGTANVCIGSTTQLTGSATPNATTPWSSGTPTVATVSNTGLVTGVAAGTSVITYKNSNGCTQTVTVTVNSLPTITGTANVCIGSTTQLTGSATPNGTTPWSSGTTTVATVSNTGLVTGVAAGTSVITYRNSNGCTQTVTVTVNPLPTITGTSAVCIGSTTQLTGSATADATTPWASGTPTVATVSNTGLVTGVVAGTSVITYKNSNGCTQTVTVTVNSLPTITGTANVCIGSTTQLTGSATPNGTTPWSSGTTTVATVSNTGLVTGVAAGTSVITYRNSNGCTQTVTVTVNPQPSAPIVGTITQPTCVVPTGSVVLSGLPSTGTWTLTRSPDAVVTTGTGTSITVSGLAANTTYTYTVGNGTCTSVSSNNIVINQLPLLATWNGGWTNGPPTINQPVVFAGNYTSAGDLNSCSCTVNAGVNVVISDGNTLTVTNAVTVNSGATLTFENNSSLMQDSEVVNTGDITYKRTSSMRLSDFEYWSTPVKPQKLVDVSPLTLSDKYFGFNGDNWVITSPNDVMTIGKGYIIRGPQNYSNTVRADFTAVFKGVPNNGNLSGETLEKNKFYLIGNPYPSALSANEFLKANNFINGTFYFWTHNTPLTISKKDYDADDYAVFNLTGGVATEGAPTGDDAPGNNPFIPQGHIAAGQSFFASTNDVGTVVFTNKMREGGANNSQFFKPGKTAKETEKSRIWLNITNDKGAFKQMLVGYIDGATNGIDNRYDGESFDANPYLDFYSINNDLNYVIQGRALPFTDTDIVPLGYRSTIEGDFAISIQHTDGELVNQPVYIEDKATGIIHNLKNGKYTFTTKAGTFGDRLVLRYTDKTLGTGDFENTENNILVSVKNKAVKVTSAKENIKEVTIYDISGKLLYSKKKVSATELQITNLQSANQVLLVKVTLDNEHTLTKKVIFQ
ncbi:T9SS sorting signal type C domain-containing protein [Flavobacterium sp. ENC]|uniref:T9SS sorting signal type C domain-containing protein n=1 Tax=Flavobacterium sp. ENC TaxID=2897330 RepID=UPI001E499335|nr:T9SS sorting signal type C domain-containing protein [Flavobacterium sp. ENC]MCD0464570.1 T9SS sorting signal type C domain-containing protein [Flavobacterium sp. ENC]